MKRTQPTRNPGRKRFGTRSLALLLAAVTWFSFLPLTGAAQVITASLSGTVTDQTGALVTSSTVLLTNEANGDKRTLKVSHSGSFTFAGVSSGDYTLTVSSPGFEKLIESHIHLDPGDSRALSSLMLKPGSEVASVTVEAETEVPLDTGERADLITSEEIKHLSVE